MNLREWKRTLFSRFEGDWDAREALTAGAALDPDCAHAYMDAAIYRQLTSDYRTWLRSQVRRIRKDAGTPKVERLFDLADNPELRSMRSVIMVGGKEYPLDSLSGEAGAAVLMAAADRDERQAKTMLSRSALARRIARAVELASQKAGRPVTVAEVIGEEQAA